MKLDLNNLQAVTFEELHEQAMPYVHQFAAFPKDNPLASIAVLFAVYLDKYKAAANVFGVPATEITMYTLAFYLGMMCERNGWHIPDEE